MDTAPGVHIRLLTPADITDKTVRDLRLIMSERALAAGEAAPYMIDAEWLRRLIDGPNQAVFAAYTPRHIVGIVLARHTEQFDGIFGHVDDSFVQKAYRRMHLGLRLFRAAEDWLPLERRGTIVTAALELDTALGDFFAASGYIQTAAVVLARLGPLYDN